MSEYDEKFKESMKRNRFIQGNLELRASSCEKLRRVWRAASIVRPLRFTNSVPNNRRGCEAHLLPRFAPQNPQAAPDARPSTVAHFRQCETSYKLLAVESK